MSEIKNIGSRCKCPVSLLWISLLLVGFASSIFAAKDYSIETIPNVRLPTGLNHVSNPDGIITPDDAARINQLLNVVEDSLGIEVAVVAKRIASGIRMPGCSLRIYSNIGDWDKRARIMVY